MKKNKMDISDVITIVFGILAIIGFLIGFCFTIALFFEYADYKLSWCLTGWFSYIVLQAFIPKDDIKK